jgi:glycosyltransferase involved in cell wall biosynthesis
MQASIIISTYNSPLWLEKVLWGFSIQTINDCEIIIADDGSTEEKKLMLKKSVVKLLF